MPVRKIPRNYRNITGRITVSDGAESKGFESSLERDFLILLDFDITVVRFEEQPVTISYGDQEGRARTYTPDVLAFYRTDKPFSRTRVPCLFEVKYREDLKKGWKEFRPKFKAAIRYAKKRGWKFKIITEREIRSEYLDNAKFLRGYTHRFGNPQDQSRLLINLRELQETDPATLMLATSEDVMTRAMLLPTLWYLVAKRRVGVDLTRPLTMASRIWPL